MDKKITYFYFMVFKDGINVPIGEYEFIEGYDADELFALFYVEKIHDPKKTWFNFVKNGGKFYGKTVDGDLELLIEVNNGVAAGKYWTKKFFGYDEDQAA